VDILEAIKTRRSIRKYQSKDVPVETIEKILELALQAPSAGNRQPWRIHAVHNASMKEKLYNAAGKQQSLLEAPWVICVVAVEIGEGIFIASRIRRHS